MRKSLRRFLALTLVLAIGIVCVAALTACGGSEKYTFSETKIDTSSQEIGSSMSGLVTTYNTLYKDTSLEVTDGKIVWTLKGDDKGEMSYTKDGDKMILSGEFTDAMKEAFKNVSFGMSVEVSAYGIKTTDGFELVVEETISAPQVDTITVKIRFLFVKA